MNSGRFAKERLWFLNPLSLALSPKGERGQSEKGAFKAREPGLCRLAFGGCASGTLSHGFPESTQPMISGRRITKDSRSAEKHGLEARGMTRIKPLPDPIRDAPRIPRGAAPRPALDSLRAQLQKLGYGPFAFISRRRIELLAGCAGSAGASPRGLRQHLLQRLTKLRRHRESEQKA